MRNQTPLAAGDARNPEAKRLARIAAQRWRELAELAQRQKTEGPPIPAHFGDASQAVHYAHDHKSRSTGRARTSLRSGSANWATGSWRGPCSRARARPT